MRLLNTSTLELHDVPRTDVHPYAILSHTWQDDELLYEHLFDKTMKDHKGHTKVRDFCQLAKDNGFEYAWVDTCCIDKKSSAELSEAINSMWAWYRGAQVCYAYLADVPPKPFRRSRWHSRGWTLQELIAPSQVVFYSKDWARMGSKQDLQSEITAATGIQGWALDPKKARSGTFAYRMAMAAYRETSRPEDMAYSLLGLLNVNMPLLYGEGGPKAFRRLQTELIKVSSEMSIFTWKRSPENEEATISHEPSSDNYVSAWRSNHSMFATSPADFVNSVHIGIELPPVPVYNRTPYSMTNMGLSIRVPLLDAVGRLYSGCKIAVLDAKDRGYVGIYIQEQYPGHHRRVHTDLLARCSEKLLKELEYHDIYIS